MSSTSERYNGLARALHWISALLIFALIGVAIYMTGLDKHDPSRNGIYALHKSMGVLLLLLLVVRIAWLRVSAAPALPSVFSGKEKLVMKGLQSLLYLLMFLVPLAGYMMSTASGYPVSFFGLFDLPVLVDKSKAVAGFFHEAHGVLAYTILAVVAVHVAGAMKHRLKDKGGESDVLARML